MSEDPKAKKGSGSSGSSFETAEAANANEPPPPPAIPLGPDGKPIKRRLSEDGKPIPIPPPKDERGNPLPPPPIIGPDGKEIPRPKDEQGRPIPIYVTEDRQPILDKQGKPIPLRYDKNGTPMPLEVTGTPSTYKVGQAAPIVPVKKRKESLLPCWLHVFACGNVIISIAMAALAGYYYNSKRLEKHRLDELISSGNSSNSSVLQARKDLAEITPAMNGLLATMILSLLGIFIGIINFAKTEKPFPIILLWVNITFLFFISQVVAKFVLHSTGVTVVIIGSVFACVRFLFVSVAACVSYCCRSEREYRDAKLYVQGKATKIDLDAGGGGEFGTGGYPIKNRFEKQGSNTQSVIMHQPQPQQVQPQYVAMPVSYPMMGYGYPYYGGFGYGYGAGLGAALLGSALYSPFYDYGWGVW